MSRTVLIVDYGGVLGDHHQEPAESQLAELLGTTVSECRRLVSERSEHGRAFREDRIAEKTFWDQVLHLAGRTSGARPSDDQLSRLWAETYRLNSRVSTLLQRARKHAFIGVVTNIDRARSKYLVDVIEIEKVVDIYLPSYRFGVTKGQAGFWELTKGEVRQKFGRVTIIYVDDRQEHVDAVAAAGCIGIHFTDAVALERELLQRRLL